MNVVDVSIESDNLDNVESKTVDSKKEKRYNRRRSQYSEFNTNAMIWANSANTQIGDTKILNNNGKFVLIEATENGYIEIESGNYDAVEGAKEYYETTNKAREIFDRYAESLEAERRRDDWSFSSTKNATYERRIAGLDSRKPASNQSRIDEQSGTDNQKFSLKSNVEETKEHKQAQYELIQKTNPKDESINKYATWIDKPSDVLTFREALEEDGGYWDGVAPDFTAEDIQKALKSGYVTVYSTYPIKNGVFVSPSRMEAESYGVRDKIHTKRVALTDVAWIDAGQGQYAKVDDAKISTNTNPTDSEDVRYSVKEIVGDSGKNYGLGVYLDSNLLEGLTEDERVEMIKEYVKELGGKSFNALDSNGNIVDIVIADNKMFRNSNGKKRPANRDLMYKNNRLPIKQEAITLVDEMVSVATYDSSKAPLYTHGWLDNNGKNDWEYYKVFIQEKNNSVWEATLNVTNSTNGEKILYDINPIKQKERGASINMETSSKKRISQTSEEVNTEDKSSLKDDYVIDNNFAVMTRERILREIEDSSAGTNKAYARRYITTISPTDYLNLTTGTRTREFFDEKIGVNSCKFI